MVQRTEQEIFDCLAENFRLAAELCDKLATSPRRGRIYNEFRRTLKICEDNCRLAAYWRQDARWLQIGLMMEEAHKRAGKWLRGEKMTDTRTGQFQGVVLYPRQLFNKLAENLRAGHKKSIELRDKKTNRVGMILPKPQRAPIRTSGRQIVVPADLAKTPKLILPPGVKLN